MVRFSLNSQAEPCVQQNGKPCVGPAAASSGFELKLQVQQQELMVGAASVAAVVVATLLLCYRKKWRRDPHEHLAGLSHTQKAMLKRAQGGADDDVSGGGGGGGADGSDGVASSSEQEQLKAKYITAIEASEAGWAMEAPVHSDENLKAWHRPEGGSIHSFKYEVIMPFEPTPLICLAREVDLIPTWHKFISKGLVLEELPGIFGGIWAYCEMWMPWPLRSRCLLLKSVVIDCLDTSLECFVVVAESGEYPGTTPLPTTPEQCPRFALGGCYTCISRLAPDAQGNARSKWVFYFDRTDYQVKNIPNFVLAFAYKVMAPFVRQICAHLVNNNFGPGSKYAERMEASPDFYGVIQSRCQEFLEEKMGKKAAGRPVPKAHASGITRRTHARAPLKRSVSELRAQEQQEADAAREMRNIYDAAQTAFVRSQSIPPGLMNAAT
mmetsp:Transcript_42927/g.115578  ORF Transcript_42927/g.115578 Transcript_42927/m.115578 type:complete len:438 (+) Transcript_42927:152-1465(+)